MMVNNHEIRFKCEKELIDKTVNAWKSVGFDLKWTAFQKRVFILGLNNLQSQIISQRENILSHLTKNKTGGKND